MKRIFAVALGILTTHLSTFYGLGWTMTSFDWLTGMTVTG